MKTSTSSIIMFVTGAFVTHRGWDEWKKHKLDIR